MLFYQKMQKKPNDIWKDRLKVDPQKCHNYKKSVSSATRFYLSKKTTFVHYLYTVTTAIPQKYVI